MFLPLPPSYRGRRPIRDVLSELIPTIEAAYNHGFNP